MATVSHSAPVRRVFISYSTKDRRRVDGLERLLDLLGHEVFIDYKRIRPGQRWELEIERALEETDVTMVFWTRSASKSEWVRKEYLYFLARGEAERPLVPILGDETPLPKALEGIQWLDFFPVINELLELKCRMEKQGAAKADIQEAIKSCLQEHGIRFDESKLKRFVGHAGWVAWLVTPLVLVERICLSFFEGVTQLSFPQIMLMLIVAASTGVIGRQVATQARGLQITSDHLEGNVLKVGAEPVTLSVALSDDSEQEERTLTIQPPGLKITKDPPDDVLDPTDVVLDQVSNEVRMSVEMSADSQSSEINLTIRPTAPRDLKVSVHRDNFIIPKQTGTAKTVKTLLDRREFTTQEVREYPLVRVNKRLLLQLDLGNGQMKYLGLLPAAPRQTEPDPRPRLKDRAQDDVYRVQEAINGLHKTQILVSFP